MTDVREKLDKQMAWMEEPCSCGEYLSHPDGGDSQCSYCDGATRMRNTMERLTVALEEIAQANKKATHTVRECEVIARKALGIYKGTCVPCEW